jgi:chromosome partitioning protein
MPVIAVVNRKGGSGKSTLATHLAAYCANAGLPVMLGDVDQQQSTQSWLRLRRDNTDAVRPPILGWTVEPARGLRPPAGTTHVVLDTPGGLSGFELARVVMFSDAILMPVCNSVFDRESAAQCLAELRSLPKVMNGRCRVAAVGMRVDAHRQAMRRLRTWCDSMDLPLIGALRDTPAYVRCIEQGLTVFDMPTQHMQTDQQQWAPILQWLAPFLEPVKSVSSDAVPRAGLSAVPARPAPVPRAELPSTTHALPPGPSGLGSLLKGWLRRPARGADAFNLSR